MQLFLTGPSTGRGKHCLHIAFAVDSDKANTSPSPVDILEDL